MAPTGKYTAADLAALGGVTVRTVRFYIQEGLIDPPLGRGRGAHFGDRHLHQLRRARAMQAVGLDNAAIRQHADELEQILSERGMTLESAGRLWTSYALSGFAAANREAQPEGDEPEADEDADEEIDAATAIRIPMAPGVELLVRRDIAIPTPKRLVELALLVRRLFKITG